ncbi:MAG: cyclophilin-like fold protein [Candidatus Ranarchaeia archaeon]
MQRIQFSSKLTGDVIAELDDERNPKTVKAILRALPIESKVNTWGDEIYFSIGINMGIEDAQQIVEIGDLGYWPPGDAFCIFFGPTPISIGNKIKAASPVNVVGKVLGDPTIFKRVKSGDEITINRVE